MGTSGEWLEAALLDLGGRIQTGLQLDADVVSGLVSYCELAPPEDAREYLTNIIGPENSEDLIREYLRKRGHLDPSSTGGATSAHPPALRPYIKPPARDANSPSTFSSQKKPQTQTQTEAPKVNARGSRKKGGKVAVSLAEAARGAVVFKQGIPCHCQARRHNLVSNCLGCGKIVCEQEGEGPCSFCGVLVLRDGSMYAGLDDAAAAPPSAAEASAEAFARRLVEYDRNSAARTSVIDDQSDYYEFETNSWLSNQEKEVLARKLKEKEEEDERRKKKVVVTFDLLGRKVLAAEEEELAERRILGPVENRGAQRITPNPAARLQPVFVETAAATASSKASTRRPRFAEGFCLEMSGRVLPGDS